MPMLPRVKVTMLPRVHAAFETKQPGLQQFRLVNLRKCWSITQIFFIVIPGEKPLN